jgi:nucleoside-diphosphate-sugar epimerase
MPHTLVIGGTGPSGGGIVHGLLERGHRMSILHTGLHEAELPAEVEHIHTDPHFKEPLAEAVVGRRFDNVIATYGRVRIIAEVFAGRTDRLITISGSAYAANDDPRWGPLGVPMLVGMRDVVLQDKEDGRVIPHKVWQAEQMLLEMHAAGAFSLTSFRYPQVYGPAAPANPDWSIVRRARDKRPLLLGDGGRRVRGRGFGPNLAQAPLLAIDRPEVSAGKIYPVADLAQYSQRALAEYIGELVGHEFEIIDIPGEISTRLYRERGARALGYYAYDTSDIQRDLGYVDTTPVPDAVARSVQWLLANPIPDSTDVEQQIGDRFDYEIEDRLAAIYRDALGLANALDLPTDNSRRHMYRHPKAPETASLPAEASRA